MTKSREQKNAEKQYKNQKKNPKNFENDRLNFRKKFCNCVEKITLRFNVKVNPEK